MSLRPDDDPDRAPHDDDEPHAPDASRRASPRRPIVHGILAALACDTLFNVPAVIFMPLVRPENIAAALGKLLLGVNMLVGYVGGRAAARAGLDHEDGRSQWTMACGVSVLSIVVATIAQIAVAALQVPRATAAAQQAAASGGGGSSAGLFLALAAAVGLTRFGFAMGTFAQARREGRAHDDQDEAAE